MKATNNPESENPGANVMAAGSGGTTEICLGQLIRQRNESGAPWPVFRLCNPNNLLYDSMGELG